MTALWQNMKWKVNRCPFWSITPFLKIHVFKQIYYFLLSIGWRLTLVKTLFQDQAALLSAKGSFSIDKAEGCGTSQSPTGCCQVADKDHFHTASSASGGMLGREPKSSGAHKFLFIVTLWNATSQIRLPTVVISFLGPAQCVKRVPPITHCSWVQALSKP